MQIVKATKAFCIQVLCLRQGLLVVAVVNVHDIPLKLRLSRVAAQCIICRHQLQHQRKKSRSYHPSTMRLLVNNGPKALLSKIAKTRFDWKIPHRTRGRTPQKSFNNRPKNSIKNEVSFKMPFGSQN